MKNLLARMLNKDEDGQGLGEYALILSFVMVVCVASVTAFGQAVVSALLQPASSMIP